MNYKISPLLFMIIIFLQFSFSCKDQGTGFIESPQTDKPQVKKSPKYHTHENEGLWPGKSKGHTPIIQWDPQDSKKIKVKVPLKTTTIPRHYIEVLVLMEGEKKQIAAKSFSVGARDTVAEFTLPDPNKTNYYIIGKCNLHDMWRAKVQKPKK